jgi:hypothetical protein
MYSPSRLHVTEFFVEHHIYQAVEYKGLLLSKGVPIFRYYLEPVQSISHSYKLFLSSV